NTRLGVDQIYVRAKRYVRRRVMLVLKVIDRKGLLRINCTVMHSLSPKQHKTIELSHNRKAAIDGERRPGDERGFVTGKPENRPGNLLRPRPATEQRRGLALGLERLDVLAGGLGFRDMEVGQRRAGTDCVDAYAVRHFLEGERAR